MNNKLSSTVIQTALGQIEYSIGGNTESTEEQCARDTIISIHGAMGGYEQSDILARAVIPDGYRYIAISRPGYLRTPLKGHETQEAQADLLAALLDALKLDRAIFLAISGGGYSALTFAHKYPERCRALLLCSTTGGKNSVPVPKAFQVMRYAAYFPLFARFMKKRFDKNIGKSLCRSVPHEDLAQQMLNNAELMSLYRELTHSTLDRMAERMPGTINDIAVTQNTEYPLEEIRVMSLIVHGTEDPVLPFSEHGQQLATRLPNARLCLAKRGGHMAIFTHNDQVRGDVSSFLSKNMC